MKKDFLTKRTKTVDVELHEVQQVEVPIHSEIAIELILIGSNPDPVKKPLRRSGRVPCQSNRYFSFLVCDGDPVELDKNDEDLITNMDVL